MMEPDDLGEIYSGCGIVDRENTSGLFDESVPPDSRLVYIYTNTNGFGQSLAYSLDGGYTLIKYENNPVIPNPGGIYGGGMRDPKVIRYDGKWILTVGGIGNQQTSIFASDDLIHWEYQSQMFHKDGSVVDADCTDLYPMTVEGTGETKWVYNGAGTFYVIGDLVKNSQGKYEFVAETAPIPYTACSDVYATQTFFNDAKGRRVAMSWLQDDPGATRIWAGQQTLPWEIGLKKSGDSYLLTSYPVEEFEAYRSDSPIFSTTDTIVKEDSANILAGIAGQKYDIEATIDPGNAEEFGFRLRQGNGRELVVKYDAIEQKMILDRSKTNEGLGRTGIHSFDLKKNPDGTINMRIIVDTSTIEAFGNQGEAVFAGIYYTEAENIGMEFYTVGDDVTVKEMNIYDVRSMYRDDQSQPTDKPTLLSLSTSPAQVEPGKEFTVYANVLPYNVADKSVAWSYDEALTLVRQDANSITLVAKEEGDYTVGAVTTLGGLEKSITISVKESLEHLFKTNLTDWQTSAGTWTYEEGGYTGVCPSGDNAAVAKQKISGDFSLEADVTLNNNHGFAALGLVMYAQDVNAAAAGAYIFNYDIGMQAFRFFRFPYRDIATVSFADAGITMEMGKTYHVKIDCKDNKFTISVEDIEIFKDLTDPDGPTYQSGRMGVLGHWADVQVQNYYVTTDSPIASVVTDIADVSVPGGTPMNEILAQLPNKVTVKQQDGLTKEVDVTWDLSNVNIDKAATYPVTGTIQGTDVKANANVIITSNTPIPTELSDLELSNGTLDPAFDKATLNYTATVANSVSSVKVMPTYTGDTAVTVNGKDVASGAYSEDIALEVGTNTITVVAGDKTYTITVTREEEEQPPVGEKPLLDGLELSEGTLTPAFDKDTFSYTAAVGNEVEGVQVKAFFADGITAMLGEEALESGVYSEEIPLQVGENEIVVTLSLEGEESEYVIVVTREEEAVTEPDPNPGTDKPSIPGSDEDQVGGGDWDWPSGSGNDSANGSGSGNSDKENPSSGDHSMIAGALAVLALSAGAAVVLSRKRK